MLSWPQHYEVLLVVGIFLPLQSPCKLKCGLQRSVWLSLSLAQKSSAALSSSRTRTFLPWFWEGNSLRVLHSRVNKRSNCSSSAWKSPEAQREQKEEDPFKVLTFKRIANNLWLLMPWQKGIFWACWRKWFWMDLLGIQTYSVQGQYRNRQSLVPHNSCTDSLNLNRQQQHLYSFLRCPAPFFA